MHTTTVPTAHFKVCGLPYLTVIHCLHIVHTHNYCSNYPLQILQLTASNTDLLSTNSTCTQLLLPLQTLQLPASNTDLLSTNCTCTQLLSPLQSLQLTVSPCVAARWLCRSSPRSQRSWWRGRCTLPCRGPWSVGSPLCAASPQTWCDDAVRTSDHGGSCARTLFNRRECDQDRWAKCWSSVDVILIQIKWMHVYIHQQTYVHLIHPSPPPSTP